MTTPPDIPAKTIWNHMWQITGITWFNMGVGYVFALIDTNGLDWYYPLIVGPAGLLMFLVAEWRRKWKVVKR